MTLFMDRQEHKFDYAYIGKSLMDAVTAGKECVPNSEYGYSILMYTPASPDDHVRIKDYGDSDPNVIKCRKCGDEIVFVKAQLKNIPVNTSTWTGERSLAWKHTVHTITCRGKK